MPVQTAYRMAYGKVHWYKLDVGKKARKKTSEEKKEERI
jgi:hypothetical protein